MTTKKERKRLKAPDAFQVKVMSYVDEMLKHRTFLYALGLGSVVLVTLILGGRYYKSEQARKRVVALSEIDQLFLSEEETAQNERSKILEKVENLEKKIDEQEKIASSKKEAKETEKKANNSNLDKDKKVLALEKEIEKYEQSLENIKADHGSSLKKFEDFYANHKDSPEGIRAAIMVINQMLDDKKFQEASSLTSDILTHLNDKPFLQIQLTNLHISILEELSKYDEALNALEQVEKMDSEEKNKASYLLTRGRLYMHYGKKDQASQTFKELMSKYENSQEANKARSFQALMYQ